LLPVLTGFVWVTFDQLASPLNGTRLLFVNVPVPLSQLKMYPDSPVLSDHFTLKVVLDPATRELTACLEYFGEFALVVEDVEVEDEDEEDEDEEDEDEEDEDDEDVVEVGPATEIVVALSLSKWMYNSWCDWS
jgi:hypothetical protein